MRPEEIHEHVVRRPFVPFRIRLTNGATYDIPLFGLCLVSETEVHIGIPDNPTEPVADRAVIVTPDDIAEVTPLSPAQVA